MLQELMEKVTASGVTLVVENGKLRGGPADKLALFASELRRHRVDVIAYLARPKAEPDEWAELFTAWLNTRCAISPRFSTNVDALYRDFAVWCEERNDWPCSLDVFTELLRQAQFTITRARDVMLVEQIGLLEDVE
jgi:hypothetical protein